MILDEIERLALVTNREVRKILFQFTSLQTEDQVALNKYFVTLVEFLNLVKTNPEVKIFLKIVIASALEIDPKKRKALLKTAFGRDMDFVDNQNLKILNDVLEQL